MSADFIKQADRSLSVGKTGKLERADLEWVIRDEEDALDRAQSLADTDYRGLPFADATVENVDSASLCAGFRLNVTYQSSEEDEEELTDAEDFGAATWNFDPEFGREPMEKHPEIERLILDYGGEVDPKTRRVIFPRTLKELPRDDSRGLLGRSRNESGEVENPLYGMGESGYLTLSGAATARLRTLQPDTAMQGIATVFDALPANAPDYGLPNTYNWLKAPPRIAEVGTTEDGERIYEIEYIFLLSPKGGWPPVYDFADL